jgi:hypothetical protein
MYLYDSSPRFFAYYSKPENFVEAMNNSQNASRYEDEFKREMLGTFQDAQALDNIVSAFGSLKNQIDTGGLIKKTRIKLSDNKKFPFSFALASKGLIRVAEYYSEELAKDFPNLFNQDGRYKSDETMVAGVVPNELVDSVQLADFKSAFFTKINGKEYTLRQQQKGTAKMLLLHPWVELKQGEDGMYYTDPSVVGDFSLSFSSTFKKSYLEMPKAGGNAKAIDIYIPLDYLNSEPQIRITSAIPLLLAYDFLTKARIKVRISVIRPIVAEYKKTSRSRAENSSSIVGIVIKDYTDPMDWNKIANGRANFDLLSSLTEANARLRIEENNLDSLDASASHLMYNNEQMLQEEFARYKNFLYEQVEKGKVKSKLVPKALMMTFSTAGLLYQTFDQSIVDAKMNGTQNRTLELIESNFFEILDTQDIYFNSKPQEVVKRIWTRFQNQGKSSRDLKNYVNRLLGKMYRDFVPKGGQYESSPEEIDKSNKDYTEKLNQYAKAYQNLGI